MCKSFLLFFSKNVLFLIFVPSFTLQYYTTYNTNKRQFSAIFNSLLGSCGEGLHTFSRLFSFRTAKLLLIFHSCNT